MKVTSTYRNHKESHPERLAIITAEQRLTYREWNKLVQQTAAAFVKQPQKEKRVAIFLPNDTLFLQLFAGANEADWAVIVGDMRWKKTEITARMKQTSPDLIIVDKRMKNDFQDIPYPVLFSDELVGWITEETYEQRRTERDNVPFYIGFTSGSTGTPKAFIRSHESWIESFKCNQIDLGMNEDEHVLIPGSFVSSTFVYGAMSTLFDGGTVYLLKKFSPGNFMKVLEKYPISVVYVVPTMIQAIVSEGYKSEKPVSIISTGAKLLPSVKGNIRKLFPQALINEFYGSSELSYVSVLKNEDVKKYDASVGRAFHNVKVSIRTEDGSEAEIGEEGILHVKSRMIFDGYINNPLETGKVKKGDWATVHDIAKMDENGYIYILGRKNDMILYGAYNIYPQEIETVIRSYDGVEEAAVIGVQDDYWGEKVAAFVKGDVNLHSLKSYCLRNLTAYKIPRIWKKLDSFPETTGGKISRQQMKKLIGVSDEKSGDC
ncbi:AMP-binding protein [Oceanobacillus chungangensis]|uniref:Acyl-CoA synthetase n=1 Tax=Oceanobacillus chungangensis TaxID=1229152 RepID=A0A3D8PVF2_9BACI|nr:AMP-binding protein [Oceanobacillus chungangensis]RDW19712.1 acyl-CoA synthetase [Oceanobacillus chungangensis]